METKPTIYINSPSDPQPQGTVDNTALLAHIADTSNPHSVTSAQVGLGQVPNVDATNASNITSGILNDARLSANIPRKVGGKIVAGDLPAYVDDVLEYANLAALPASGASGIIYITTDNNKQYRWSGSTYIEIVPSPGTTDVVVEGSTNKYWTNARTIASVLTGYVKATVSRVIAATDSILVAFQILEKKIDDVATDTTITKQGNTFNAASKLVQLTAANKYPALDGSLITNLPAATNTVSNSADSFTSIAKINQIVSLTQTEYDSITSKDPNTLYIIP